MNVPGPCRPATRPAPWRRRREDRRKDVPGLASKLIRDPCASSPTNRSCWLKLFEDAKDRRRSTACAVRTEGLQFTMWQMVTQSRWYGFTLVSMSTTRSGRASEEEVVRDPPLIIGRRLPVGRIT